MICRLRKPLSSRLILLKIEYSLARLEICCGAHRSASLVLKQISNLFPWMSELQIEVEESKMDDQ